MQPTNDNPSAPDFWSPPFRVIIFILAATSIWSLLSDFFHWCSMRTFTLFIALPALALLGVFAVVDRVTGNRRLWRACLVGAGAGLLAAVSYDVFRLPFVFAKPLGIASVVPALNLYKVFPQFGALILNQPLEQAHYSPLAQWVGWTYHFSNGLTFGIMYVALVGLAQPRHWGWGVLFAVGLELAMLFTPYPAFFHIPLTATFVAVTLAAHLIFGVVMGCTVRSVAAAQPDDCGPGGSVSANTVP